MSWDDLHAFIFASQPGTAMFHAVEQGWGTGDYLSALMVDALHDIVWQSTKDGRKGRKRPKRVPRPKRKSDDGTASTGLGRVTVMPAEEFERRRAERQQGWIERNRDRWNERLRRKGA